MKAAPTFDEVEEKLRALVSGRISRDEADRWAGQWVYDPETPQMPDALWTALLRLAGCDLRDGKDGAYLHSASEFQDWLRELKSGASDQTT